ncbi:MAG: hypothetical protein HXY40_03135 [Chloroflexi bacterium]|nr:hypothetical protein [Chloroflexota bacterium]
MSTRYVPYIVCDGCGTVIEADYHIRISPQQQPIVQRDPNAAPQRDFCCEACAAWWHAQFPANGPWGPAWDERAWWCDHVGPCAASVHIRTTHEEAPLVDTKVHFVDAEKLPKP